MIFPLPPRDPADPLEPQHLLTLARDARLLVATIRAYLPLVGETEAKAHRQTIARWYDQALSLYERIERLRNPLNYSYRKGVSSSYCMDSAEGSGPPYVELGYALDALCEHYGWQGISDGSARPLSNVRSGGTIPPIPSRLLDAIESPAQWLYALNKGFAEQAQAPVSTDPSQTKGIRIRIVAKAVFVDGQAVPLNCTLESTDDALAFLGELLKEPGNWMSSRDIGKAAQKEGVRFDRTYKRLPEPIKSLLESDRRKGYRVRR